MTNLPLPIDAMRRVASSTADHVDARTAAIERLQSSGLPSVRAEDWKYTDLGNVVDISQRWLGKSRPVADRAALIERVTELTNAIDAHWLVIANGAFDATLSAEAGVDGLSVDALADLRPTPSPAAAALVDLNTVLFDAGLHIDVQAHTTIDKPVAILFIDTDEGVAHSRLKISLGHGSSTQFIEYHASSGSGEHYANVVIDLDIAESASASYVRLQDRAREHSQTQQMHVRLSKDGELRHVGIDIGGRLTRNDLTVDIAGPGSSAEFDGLYLVGDNQHVDNHTRVDHRVGPAHSSQEYRGILRGHCRGVWNGKAVVHEGADGTDATQANHNLLLTRNAEINAKPELEIYADDVKCSHGTTVGQLDESALFYLRSRGLDRQQAEHLLTDAFAAAITSRVPVDAVADAVSTKTLARLHELTDGNDA